MEHAKHIIRALLLLIVIAVVFVFARHFAIPETFGAFGHYRFGNVEEHAAQPPVHGSPRVCVECHDEEGGVWSEGAHGTVSCEVCHAPLSTHVGEDNKKIADMVMQRSFSLCARCHRYVVARPKDFPQVVLPDHVTEKGGEMTEHICWECHEDAHDPATE